MQTTKSVSDGIALIEKKKLENQHLCRILDFIDTVDKLCGDDVEDSSLSTTDQRPYFGKGLQTIERWK